MKISGAAPGKKGLTALYVDEKFQFSVDTGVYLDSGLRPGSAVTEEDLRELLGKSDSRRAERKALRLLGMRSYSRAELERKLARSFPRAAAAHAVERMETLGFLNDREYARSLAGKLFGEKHYGAGRVRLELARRGISRETAEQAMEQSRPEDPGEGIRVILERKYPGVLRSERDRRRAAASLRRLGYGWEEIIGAFRKYADKDE